MLFRKMHRSCEIDENHLFHMSDTFFERVGRFKVQDLSCKRSSSWYSGHTNSNLKYDAI
jgi:hypothetical protein